MDASLQDWKRLVEAAARIKQLAPWEWMDEEDVFGIRYPGTGEIGFVSVMGGLGEHYAVALYLGSEALARFREIQEDPDVLEEYPELLMEVPQLQASFEDRNQLEEWDRQLLHNLGMKFRGRQAWPLFQSFRAGFMPWRLETEEEVRYLTLALEQLEQVAPRVEEDSDLLEQQTGAILVRSCRHRDGAKDEWADGYELPPDSEHKVALWWNPDDVKKLKRARKAPDILELDFFMLPSRIGEKGQRPQLGYVLLALHAQSNLVFGLDPLTVTEALENVLGRVPGMVLARLADNGLRPKEIHVQSPRLGAVLLPAFEELGTKIVHKPVLKKLRAAKREMFAFFAKGGRR
jgi:hypothetical protein